MNFGNIQMQFLNFLSSDFNFVATLSVICLNSFRQEKIYMY